MEEEAQLLERRNRVMDGHESLGMNGPSLGQEDHCVLEKTMVKRQKKSSKHAVLSMQLFLHVVVRWC